MRKDVERLVLDLPFATDVLCYTFTRTLWAITYSSSNVAQCFECMRVCPAAHGLQEMR